MTDYTFWIYLLGGNISSVRAMSENDALISGGFGSRAVFISKGDQPTHEWHRVENRWVSAKELAA